MTVLRSVHEAHGATFTERGGRSVVLDYGRPERTVTAVRNVAGVTEAAYGIVSVTGDDRVDYVDNAVTNAVPTAEGDGSYALLLDPDGKIRTDMYVYHAGERLLVFVPPGEAESLAAEWTDKTFIEDVNFEVATAEFGVFGVHGPKATEKVASVFTNGTPPDERLTFDRGQFDDVGVTVLRTDAPTGEEGYEVVCAADSAEKVFDVLVNQGLNAAPFGWKTWDTLTLEAGTPLFASELDGRLPNVVGVRNALDFEKGCYVGQEVVSRIENRGRPPERLVGIQFDAEAVPEAGAAVMDGDAAVGELTRVMESPTLDATIAMAVVAADLDGGFEPDAESTEENRALSVRVAGEAVAATIVTLPFVDGSDRSARVPRYV
ncbi:glycine cleavage system protein T [Salinarchaeum sp. Harcht-Bsk1]|uniref:CAF17-like 4Fe-4S cluster assembly/insertion protein YgfZ n=1 Tax=Salinarchaeum sp. Harcht-Bsk1 TaxID=1333523 RepID=UPI000342493B|nr:glycine cleavage T C-terminal barrel domain-containing protein [Salinarchaeum sp. Harcht-Bsk1]AGN02590.1 glycine cleavage system protein T [Salinarchaeum sp. Harcht-Bsk1]